MKTPNWMHWLAVKSLTLEDAVSISLNCQPTIQREVRETYKSQGAASDSTSVKWLITPHCIEDDQDRLHLTRQYFDAGHELLPAYAEEGKSGKRVRLSDFVRFAVAMGWEIPARLAQAYATTQHSTEATERPRPTRQHPDSIDPSEQPDDPSDLPLELDAANIAFRAVSNGYGNPLEKFKSRLIAYLRENYPSFSDGAIDRISTAANTDKSPGRKGVQTK